MVIDIVFIIEKYLMPLGLGPNEKEFYLALSCVVVQVFFVWLYYKIVRLFI